MNFALRLLVFVLLFCAWAGFEGHVENVKAARNGDAQISVGDIELTLGMSKGDVMRALSSHYILRGTEPDTEPPGNRWWVEEKSHKGSPVAILAFTDGKLRYVLKPWLAQSTRTTRGGVEVGRAVYGILAILADRHETNCTVRVDHTETPTLSGETATIKCGPHSLSVAVSTSPNEQDSVEVQESLN